jgi:hypothetical protein
MAPENTTEWTQITKNQKLHYYNNIIFKKVAANQKLHYYNNIIFKKVAAILILLKIYLPMLSLLWLINVKRQVD